MKRSKVGTAQADRTALYGRQPLIAYLLCGRKHRARQFLPLWGHFTNHCEFFLKREYSYALAFGLSLLPGFSFSFACS
jgi:hypothetical protein